MADRRDLYQPSFGLKLFNRPFRRAGAAQGVVASDRIGHDLRHEISGRRHQLRPAAQVHIALLADGIDGAVALGRARLEEIERQIRAAFAEPAERDGRYETRR